MATTTPANVTATCTAAHAAAHIRVPCVSARPGKGGEHVDWFTLVAVDACFIFNVLVARRYPSPPTLDSDPGSRVVGALFSRRRTYRYLTLLQPKPTLPASDSRNEPPHKNLAGLFPPPTSSTHFTYAPTWREPSASSASLNSRHTICRIQTKRSTVQFWGGGGGATWLVQHDISHRRVSCSNTCKFPTSSPSSTLPARFGPAIPQETAVFRQPQLIA